MTQAPDVAPGPTPALTPYQQATNLHDYLVAHGRIVRMQTDPTGTDWWVEYADRFTGIWKRA